MQFITNIDNEYIYRAYASLYLFLVCSVYWCTNVLHPDVVSLVPIAFVTLTGPTGWQIISTVHIRSPVLDCVGMMLMTFGVENSNLHKRLAIKILLIFGISHFRLSFVLFFSTMLLSMCFSDTLSCCLMLPVVHATLIQLEMMGIVDMHEAVQKNETIEENSQPANVPADFTIFYYLGIVFSSTIGGTANVLGNSSNGVLLNCYTAMFPLGPKVEFPQILLMTLPGALLMEAVLYLWLNFYFLGMLRVRNYTALEAGLTGEEVQYVNILLRTRYAALGRLSIQEMMVIGVVAAAAFMEICLGVVDNYSQYSPSCYGSFASSPLLVGALLLFILPVDVGCIRFCKKKGSSGSLPATPSRACLEWSSINKDILCSVICVTAGCNVVFDSLHNSGMLEEFGKFLALITQWPILALTLLIIILCKILTEFASNTTVTYYMLQEVAKLSVLRKTDPRYLMMSATLACSLSFHLITSSPVNAFVKFYGNIPRRKMMIIGMGPTVMAVFTTLFTTCVWSKAIWPITNLI